MHQVKTNIKKKSMLLYFLQRKEVKLGKTLALEGSQLN